MDLTYREKRIWISLITQFVVYAIYFIELHRGAVTNIRFLLIVVVGMVVLQVILQTVLAITARPQPKDERDIAIERIAFRNAYNILVVALLVCLAMLSVPAWVPSMHFHVGAFHIVNVLLFILLLAELGKLGSQLAMYRRAA